MDLTLLLATFVGPRATLGEALGAFNAAGMPAEASDARFHAAEPPNTKETSETSDEDAPEPVAPSKVNADGTPVWTGTPSDGSIDVLCSDLSAAQEIAARHRYRLAMHGPSGFASSDEAAAIAAGLHNIARAAELLESLRRALDDPTLAPIVTDLMGTAR